MFNAITLNLTELLPNIKSAFSKFLQDIKVFLGLGEKDEQEKNLNSPFSTGKNIIKGIFDGIINLLSPENIKDKLESSFENIKNEIKKFFGLDKTGEQSWSFLTGKNVVENIANGIKANFEKIKEAIKTGLRDFIRERLQSFGPPLLDNIFSALGLAHGGKVPKMGYGGRVNYKGSRERAPGFALGSMVPGMGNVDRVPAMLMPGEYVVNKASTRAFLPFLEAINNTKFPRMLDIPRLIPADAIMFNTPTNLNTDIESVGGSNISIFDSSSKNQYQINVNVNGTNASADQIANAVFGKIKMVDKKQIQGVRR
jgi:hypothetical protein